MSISDEEIHRLRQGPYTVWNKRFLHESLMSALDEVERLREILAIKEAAREMASAAYRDAESDLAKAVEALRLIRNVNDCPICQASVMAGAVLKELEK